MSSPVADKATPFSAILLIVASGILFTFLDTSAKYLVVNGMAPEFVAWARFAVHAALAFFLLRGWSNADLYRANSLWRQLLRGAMLFGSTAFNFLALQSLQLAETMSIYFFGPMIVTALAGPLLGEWAGWRRWLAILIAFVGVLIITRPGLGAIHLGHLWAMCSVLSASFYTIMTRAMRASETPDSMIFYSALAPTVLLAPVLPVSATMPSNALSWALIACLGLCGGVGHWMVIQAYRRATITALAPYPYFQMIWMIVAGYLVFDQLPDRWTLLGASIIVASGLYIVHREHRLRLAGQIAPANR